MKYELPTKDDLVETPRDTVADAVIINVDIETWTQRGLSNESLQKLTQKEIDVEAPQCFFTYETGEGFRGDFVAAYYKQPSDRSKLGRILSKYGSAEPGTKIKVHFNDEGRAEVQL